MQQPLKHVISINHMHPGECKASTDQILQCLNQDDTVKY